MALNGSLDDYSPAGALRVLSSTGKTGAVRFSGEAGCTVYLDHGQLYFARDDSTDQSLATALVRQDRLTAEDWATAIEQAGESPRVGELLVGNGAIDPDLLASVTLSVIYDPLIRLFREGDGAFDFEPDTVHWIGPFRTFNVDAIVNEVRRRVREVDEMSPLVPSIDSWVTARPSLPGNAVQVTLLREDWELVTVLAGPRTITELAADMGRGRYSTARVVHRLAQAGLVDVVPEFLDAVDTTFPDAELAELAAGLDTPTVADPTFSEVFEPTEEAFSGFTDISELDGMLDDEGWTEPIGDEDADAATPGAADEHAVNGYDPTGFTAPIEPGSATWGNGYDPHPATSEPDAAEVAWALPQRQPVALQEDPAGRTSPWPAAEDLDADDPAANNHIPGLEGINGFRNAVGAEAIADATSDTARDADMHPNAVWLESLYAEYMDEPEVPTKKRKKEMLDVAFAAEEQDQGEKVGTLRRLMDALKKL